MPTSPLETNPFKIIDRIWRNEDAFDAVLNGSLFKAINDLQDVAGSDPVWAKVVFELLYDYLMGFFFYHFQFSYGNPDPKAYKPERQRDLEQHIHKLLSTEARSLISTVCISSLHGKGWQTLYGIRPWRFSFTLNPLKLYRRFLWRGFKLFLRLLQRTALGERMSLEVFGLFDRYTSEEFNEMLLKIEQHSRIKRSYAYNEWDILYIVRLLARPERITQNEQETLADRVLSIEFTREDIRAEVLAEVAKFSDRAVAALDTYQKTDLVDRLVTSAHINPLSMKKLISALATYSSYGYSSNVDDVLAKLERLEVSSAEALIQTALSEESVFSSAALVATHISALTIEARELLISQLNSSDPHLRYLSACALLQTTRSVPTERAKVFNSIMQLAIGPKSLEVTSESYSRSDPLQKMAVHLLLDLAESDPLLIKRFLIALRDAWKNDFAIALRRLLSEREMTDELVDELVDYLLGGDLLTFRMRVSQLCSETHYLPINDALDRIADNDLLFYIRYDDGLPEAKLVSTCAGYAMRVWPCLTFLTEHMSNLREPHLGVIAALIALDKPGRNRWSSIPISVSYSERPGDSFVNMCRDLSLAIHILERLDEEYILNLLITLEPEAEYRAREQIMRALRLFPRANQEIMSLIVKGLADSEREVCQAAQESLYCLPYLDADGVDLIIETVVSPRRNIRTGMSDNLVEHPQPVAPSAIPRVVEVLNTANDITSPNIVHEVWLVEYCLNVLKFVPQEGTEFIELYKQKLRTSYSNEDLRRHLRPYLILALGRVRPITAETVEMLLNFTKPGRARLMIRSMRDLEFPEIKMAAAIALTEIGADETNGIDWKTRETIANHLIWAAKQPLPHNSAFVGGKDVFPKDPHDAMYQCAKTMALVMKRRKGKEQVATQGIAALE